MNKELIDELHEQYGDTCDGFYSDLISEGNNDFRLGYYVGKMQAYLEVKALNKEVKNEKNSKTISSSSD